MERAVNVTQASIRAARSVLDRYASTVPLYQIANDLLAGEFGRSNWWRSYWSHARLFSVEARRCWAEPDIAPLPF